MLMLIPNYLFHIEDESRLDYNILLLTNLWEGNV